MHRVVSYIKTGIDTRCDGQWQRQELRPFSPAEPHNMTTPVDLKEANLQQELLNRCPEFGVGSLQPKDKQQARVVQEQSQQRQRLMDV